MPIPLFEKNKTKTHLKVAAVICANMLPLCFSINSNRDMVS